MPVNISSVILWLEKINQIIDLCIDREIYDSVREILPVAGRSKCAKYIKGIEKGKKGERFSKIDFSRVIFPISRIEIPSNVRKIWHANHETEIKTSFELKGESKISPLLRAWSDLLWTKRIRAEFQKHNNQREWIDQYEDLIQFLENRITARKPYGVKENDFIITQFNYLMELSALAQGEASLGYAERARKLLGSIFTDPEDQKRAPYDRWITWNKGTAYQHSSRNQKAVLEFNWVIKKFWYRKKSLESKKILFKVLTSKKTSSDTYTDLSLEFLVNIAPAYLQRASINLRLQLGYHAIQTLSMKNDNLDEILLCIIKNNKGTIFEKSASHLRKRMELLWIEALLQLEQVKLAGERLEKCFLDIFGLPWDLKEPSLPTRKESEDSQIAIKIQLVEQAVSYMLARGREATGTQIYGINDENFIKDLSARSDRLVKAMGFVRNTYWEWVDGNQFDEQIFFSKWAQFLSQGSKLLNQFRKYHVENRCSDDDLILIKRKTKNLLDAIADLYSSRRYHLPSTKCAIKEIDKQNFADRTLKIERLRSDDRPDFFGGLSDFYKEMSKIFLIEDTHIQNAAQHIFRKNNINFERIKKDHFNVIDALNEYEEEFGENQKIGRIKRYNQRIWWSKDDATDDCEDNCIAQRKGPFSQGSFNNLILCNNSTSNVQKDLSGYGFLSAYDYEKIMKDSEDHFKKHLASRSYQAPRKESLHFLGLQRWNSLTPAQGRSVGGGYFIYHTDKDGAVDLGIAVDPGFDFVRNLFCMGFSLIDVDIVLISHAHPDHLWDFESMIQLLHELEDKEHITKRLNVILTLGSYKRLEHIINNPTLRGFINPLVIDIRKEIDPDFFENLGLGENSSLELSTKFSFYTSQKGCSVNAESGMRWEPFLTFDEKNRENNVNIFPTRAYHDDYSDKSDSYGFIIQFTGDLSDHSDRPFVFGYTGDTKWVGNDLYSQEFEKCPICSEVHFKPLSSCNTIAAQYRHCDTILLHLGSLIDHKNNDNFRNYSKCESCKILIRKKNHPYLIGMIRFISCLYHECRDDESEKLFLLSEFGEELRGGIRIDLIKRFQDAISKDNEKDWHVLPVDVGLDILLHSYDRHLKNDNKCRYKFRCSLCDKFCSISQVEYERFGHDEAIFHICKTCMKAEPFNVSQTKLRQLYDVGRELFPAMDRSYKK